VHRQQSHANRLDCQSGQPIRHRVKGDELPDWGHLGRGARVGQEQGNGAQGLGHSGSEVERQAGRVTAQRAGINDTPLEKATTPSLEALKAFSLGVKTEHAKANSAALALYKRAVELDPNFAFAYHALSVCYSNLNEQGLAAEYARKAYELRVKVSELERFSIEANYYWTVTGELDKAAQTYELWQQSYPRSYVPYGNLGFISNILGNHEKALREYSEALHLEPNDAVNYSNLGTAYSNLNRLDEEEALYKQADDRKLENEGLLVNRYQLAFLKGDAAQMERLFSAAMGTPGTEDLMLAERADHKLGTESCRMRGS
jgi:tetratricopeptide (TPR) repeat protein